MAGGGADGKTNQCGRTAVSESSSQSETKIISSNARPESCLSTSAASVSPPRVNIILPKIILSILSFARICAH